jgi:UPF0755 protein
MKIRKASYKIIIVFLFLSLLLFLGLWNRWNSPSHLHTQAFLIEVPSGASARTIADSLLQYGLIPSKHEVLLYLRLTGQSRSLKSGVYEIPSNASMIKALEIIASGQTATKRVVIPEGLASWEIWGLLYQAFPHLQQKTFKALLYDSAFIASLGWQATSLEGYLFPSTYQFPWRPSEAELIRIMSNALRTKLQQIDFNHPFVSRYGIHGLITLASIVEKETSLESERKRIAGVFVNRLQRGISLGADPTVRFIFRNLTGPIYLSQLQSNSPYNTRKFRGLPPGPIASPGWASIEAVLDPVISSELYFVAKDDGSRKHYFSSSLAEHNRYRQQAARNRRQ